MPKVLIKETPCPKCGHRTFIRENQKSNGKTELVDACLFCKTQSTEVVYSSKHPKGRKIFRDRSTKANREVRESLNE